MDRLRPPQVTASGPPLVSIVTPSYRQGRFLRGAIDSVLSQDHSPIEYCVMDGGSDDGTLEVLRAYEGRLAWESRRDGGQAEAVNRGWAHSRGEILGWLNSDDRYTPGAVSRAVAYLQGHPEVDGVYGEGLRQAPDGTALGRYPTSPRIDASAIKLPCRINQPTVFLRREAVWRLGGLREHLYMALDYDLWIRLLMRGRLGYIPEAQAVCLEHPDTKSARAARRRAEEFLKIMQEAYRWVPRVYLYDTAWYRRFDTPQGEPGAPSLTLGERLSIRAEQAGLMVRVNLWGGLLRACRGIPELRGDLARHLP